MTASRTARLLQYSTLRGKTARRAEPKRFVVFTKWKKEVFTKRSLIAVFNRLADWEDPPQKKLNRCNSFLLQKDNNGHPRDGGGTVYVSVVKFLEYQWRITTGGCTSKLRNQETNYSDYEYDYE